MQHLMTGKVKEVYAIDEDTLEFAYTDHISVFDKIIPSLIPHKGETLCRTAKFWFNLLTKEGINNHFISEPSKDRMDVRRVQIIRDYSKIDGKTVNFLIPLEVICRHYAAGSLMDRVKKGSITAEMLGFPAGHEVKYGEKLPKPFVTHRTPITGRVRTIIITTMWRTTATATTITTTATPMVAGTQQPLAYHQAETTEAVLITLEPLPAHRLSTDKHAPADKQPLGDESRNPKRA